MTMMTFTVVPDDGEPFGVPADARDFLVWEKTHKDKNASTFDLLSNLRLIELYRVAHIAARRLGLYNGTLADFEATCAVKVGEDDEESVDPTPPAPSPDE